MATYAGTRPGSGDNFKKLSGTLAARGAHNPDALAAWIGRGKYGRKGMSKLSAKGGHHAHSNPLGLASEEGGEHSHVVTHSHEFASLAHTHEDAGAGYEPGGSMREGQGSSGGVGDFESGSSKLRTPQEGDQRSTGFRSQRLGVGARAGNYGSMSNTGGRAVSLAQRLPVTSPWDVVISRGIDGSAQVRHRRGGTGIGSIRRIDGGGWTATPDGGSPLPGHPHQRAALMELLGTWNRSATTPDRAGVPYAQPAQQTPLMEKFGVPAIRALATPTVSAGDGPRTTMADASSGSDDTDGLTPKGKAIYAKLRSRGFPAERALAFAKRAQNMGPKAAA
jgi:hypothetical protein